MAIAREKRTGRSLVSCVGYLLLIPMTQQGYADNFPFSSTVENTNINISFLMNCNRADGVSSFCTTGGSAAAYTDPTPFLQEVVYIDNVRYYHLIVGDAAQGFVQEVYINATACCYQQRDGWPKSASDDYGSGHPGAVVFRMMMSDEDFEQQIIKDTLATKPVITQLTDDAQSSGAIEIDMSGINYSTADVSGTITNTFQISDPGLFNAGNFDMGMVSEGHVTAGRYTYTRGPGTFRSGGPYTYADDAYLLHQANESLFKDPAQNP